MNNRRYLLLIMLAVMTFTGAFAQHRISGHVSDGIDTLFMANVVERDVNDSIISITHTDKNGNFSMTIKSPKNYLEVTYVGYEPYKVKIGSKTKFNIIMKELKAIRCTELQDTERQLLRPNLAITDAAKLSEEISYHSLNLRHYE